MTRRLLPALLTATALVLAVSACTDPPGDPDDRATGTPTASETATGNEPTDDPAEKTQDATALGAWGVSSGHPLASQAGMQMLERGGTAIDAAVATAFADAVVQPASSGIGGGGASIVVVDGEAVHYDYREYVNAAGVVPEDGVGVPGFVAGLRLMHQQHGALPWQDLLVPAIAIAEDGAPVSPYFAPLLSAGVGQQVTATLPHFRRDNGTPLQEGDVLVQHELATTMRSIAQDPNTVYRGELADQLLDVPGLDQQTLADYQVQISEPAAGQFGEHTLLSGAPPLPGAAIIQLLQIAEAAGIGDVDPDSADFVDIQSQAWQVAQTSVQQHFGDPDYVDVPLQQLTDAERNAQIAADLPGAQTTSAASALQDPDDGAANTTHISVVDTDGTAISMTNSITNYWGSGRYLAGFFLNDQLTRFSEIGTTDANTPQPGRRSVSWSAPSMVVDDQGQPILVIGTPGGQQIPNTLATVLTRWSLHDQDLDQAVPAERFILTDGILWLESDQLVADLRTRGYDAQQIPPALIANHGSVQALEIDWDQRTVTSHADHRRSAGYTIASEDDPQPRTSP